MNAFLFRRKKKQSFVHVSYRTVLILYQNYFQYKLFPMKIFLPISITSGQRRHYFEYFDEFIHFKY